MNPATPDFKNNAAERGVALAAVAWLLVPLILAAMVMLSSWMAFKQLTTVSSNSKSDLAGSIRVHRAQPVGNVGLIFTDLTVTVGGHRNQKASRCLSTRILSRPKLHLLCLMPCGDDGALLQKLVDNVFGMVQGGTMVALMGESGAGVSTRINVAGSNCCSHPDSICR